MAYKEKIISYRLPPHYDHKNRQGSITQLCQATAAWLNDENFLKKYQFGFHLPSLRHYTQPPTTRRTHKTVHCVEVTKTKNNITPLLWYLCFSRIFLVQFLSV